MFDDGGFLANGCELIKVVGKDGAGAGHGDGTFGIRGGAAAAEERVANAVSHATKAKANAGSEVKEIKIKQRKGPGGRDAPALLATFEPFEAEVMLAPKCPRKCIGTACAAVPVNYRVRLTTSSFAVGQCRLTPA